MDKQATLMQELNFSAEELVLNQQGLMSDAQKRRIRRDSFGSLAIAVVAGAALLWVLLMPADSFTRPLLMRSIYGAITSIVALIGLVVYQRETSVVRNAVVSRVSGVPVFEKRRTIHQIKVDNRELWVTRALEQKLEDEQAYHFYFASGSPILLSAELTTSPPS